ncbi:hypothetical protein M9458_051674 [Cirrhinus mrigala]|uniref:GAGE domain-containing protein n=1 Tax=Cirrhinus mrigala TaxID=683832 RepID=A0ABD0MVQ0_CIRMR
MPEEKEERDVPQITVTRSQTRQKIKLGEKGIAGVPVEEKDGDDEASSDSEEVDTYIPLQTLDKLWRLPESQNQTPVPQDRKVSIPGEDKAPRPGDNHEKDVRIIPTVEDPSQDQGVDTPVEERNDLPFLEELESESNLGGPEPNKEMT